MELPINTVVILIVLLVLVIVVLILVSRGGNVFTDFGGEKIETGGDVSECEILCWECCRYIEDQTVCGTPLDLDYDTSNCNCNC